MNETIGELLCEFWLFGLCGFLILRWLYDEIMSKIKRIRPKLLIE